MDILYRIEAYRFHANETLGGYLLMEGNVAGPWLAATGCVDPDAQEQKPSTKPWVQRKNERDICSVYFRELRCFYQIVLSASSVYYATRIGL